MGGAPVDCNVSALNGVVFSSTPSPDSPPVVSRYAAVYLEYDVPCAKSYNARRAGGVEGEGRREESRG